MRRLLLLLTALTAISCVGGKDDPVAPSPTPACETNNTAEVRFGNRSAATTHTVFWDGLNVATIAPGQDSPARTVAAGVAHQLQTRIANTNSLACAASSPIPARCSQPIYTCAFP